jgi:hypothetical protein
VETVTAAVATAFAILDGTLLPIDRIADDRPFFSGKHRTHGMNLRVLADPFGRLLSASGVLPGAVHDIKAARTHGIIDALAAAQPACSASLIRAIKVPAPPCGSRSAAGTANSSSGSRP